MILIIIILLSALMGNFVTTFFYRLPRNININRDSAGPMCSKCGAILKFYEYMPLIHILFFGRKSRCCKEQISIVYTIIELFVIFINICIYFSYGLEYKGIIMLISVPIFTCAIFIFYYHNSIPRDIVWSELLCLILFKCNNNVDILYNNVFMVIAMVLILLIIEKVQKKYINSHIRITIVIITAYLNYNVYTVFVILSWFLITKEKINQKQSNLIITAMIGLFFIVPILHKI